MRQLFILVFVTPCLLFGSFINFSYAGEEELKRYDPISKSCRTLDFDSFWYGKGRRLFDQKCKVCHTRNNSENAPFLYSESKPPQGWTRVFSTKYPKCAQTGAWQVSSNEALLINDYLFRYGANTHTPNKAS
jgi:hypothetical protein